MVLPVVFFVVTMLLIEGEFTLVMSVFFGLHLIQLSAILGNRKREVFSQL